MSAVSNWQYGQEPPRRREPRQPITFPHLPPRVWTLVALAVVVVVVALAMGPLFTQPSSSTAGGEGYAYGQVIRISQSGQMATVRLYGGQVVEAQTGSGGGVGVSTSLIPHYHVGDRVELAFYVGPNHKKVFAIDDYQRGPALVWLLVLFVAIAVVVGRGKAFRAVVGMGAALAIVTMAVIPAILHGANPVGAAVLGSGGILVLTMYFVHGLNWKTTAALIGTLVAMLIAIYIGALFLHMAHITNFGTEESLYLTEGKSKVNIQGLVLASVVIGALGALVDITIGQASSVAELAHLGGDDISLGELYRRGMNVGFDHIGSLVNTLVLAYIGTGLPTLALIALEAGNWQYDLNLELVGVAIVQALVGATVLILAVPLTTFAAAALFKSGRLPYDPNTTHGHAH